MPFQKGKIKTGGKVKGSENITTKKGRELFIEILEGEIDNVKLSLDDVRKENPYNYLNVLSKLLPYFMPKLTDITTKGESLNENMKNLSDEELAKIIEKLEK